MAMKNPSKVVEFPLTSTTKTNVVMTKKRMKNIRLKISKSGKVTVSMPYYTTYSYAYEFLVRKRDWIVNELNKINANIKQDGCHFVDGGNVFVLGKSFPLVVKQSAKNKVLFDSNHILTIADTTQPADNTTACTTNPNYGFIIHSKDTSEQYIEQMFIKWCKKYFLDFFTNRLNFIYHQIFKSNPPPVLKIKTMKSMWGNCNYAKRVVALSLYLCKARIECIDYVITHELCHLVHHNHGKDFYALMTTVMPDWKARKKMLNNYSLKF